MTKQIKPTEQDILGEEKPVSSKLEKKKKEPIVKIGDVVLYNFSAEVFYPAMVLKMNPSGSLDLAVFSENHVDFRKKVPFSAQQTGGTYQLK